MGNSVQKVLKGRGGKKGKAAAVAALLPLLPSYAGLAAGFAVAMPALWFSYSATVFVLYAAASLIMGRMGKRPRYTEYLKAAAFVSAGLLAAGASGYLSLTWLHISFIPLGVIAASALGARALLAVLSAVTLIEIDHIIHGNLSEELTLVGAVWVSAGVATITMRRLRRRAERLSMTLRSMRDGAVESLEQEDLIAHGASMRIEADEEISELLATVRKSLGTDSATLFLYRNGALMLRLSSETEGIVPSGEGLIQMCGNRKQPVLLNEPKEGYNPGYMRKGDIFSMMAAPVMDGSIALGVLVADSEREGAFGRDDLEALGLFSKQVVRVLKKQRILSEMERSEYGLRVLHEESAALIASLSVEHIAGKTAEGAHRIAPLKVAVLLREKGGYRLSKEIGLAPPKKKLFHLKNTLLEMAIKNREHIYISNMKSYSLPAVPFDAGHVGSVLMLPLLYEKTPLGAVVVISEKTGALNTHQIELLEVLGNQASTSIVNAMLHEKIEKMATTDGLTGLYNHRHFQERLNDELKRLDRFPKPLTLMIIDIDFFKKVNDAYGHPAGDAVLKSVAALIKNAVRDVDMPARYGGEEFAAVLVGTDGEGGRETAERLRQSIENTEFQVEGSKLRITVSIGVASIPMDAKTKEELIDRADKSLYRAKKGGRNRVVTWAQVARAMGEGESREK